MITHQKYILFALLILLIASYSSSCSSLVEFQCNVPKVGCTAPDFTFSTIRGETIRLEELRGLVVVVNFWATWCGPCQAESPDLERIYQEYASHGLTILGISYEDNQDQIKKFADQYSLTYPLLVGEPEISKAYNVSAFPTSYFIDTDGKIFYISVGSLTKQQIEEILSSVFDAPETNSAIETVVSDKALDVEGCVKADYLNVRKSPSVDSPAIDWLKKGDCEQFNARSSDSSWLRLTNSGNWVSAKYISLNGELLDLPIAP